MTRSRPAGTFDDFFVAEYPRLVAMLTARYGDRATAEDVAQEALFTAGTRWDDVRRLDRPGAWVRRVALNRSWNEQRRLRRERTARERLASGAGQTAQPEPIPDADLWARVRSLPRAQRDAVILRYVDDLPLAAIAEVVGCAEGTVKQHLHRARRTLAEHLPHDREADR